MNAALRRNLAEGGKIARFMLSSIFPFLKQKITPQDLAAQLAESFVVEVSQDYQDMKQKNWIWDMATISSSKELFTEWLILKMFVRAVAFRQYCKKFKQLTILLDTFHGHTLELLVQNGDLQTADVSEELLQTRYQTYYTEVKKTNDPGFQFMKIIEACLRSAKCSYTGTMLGALCMYFTHLYLAEKNLINTLEKKCLLV